MSKSVSENFLHKYKLAQAESFRIGGKIKEAKEAYEVLSSEEKRAAYDRFGHEGVSGAGFGAGAAGGESDIGILLREGTAGNLYNFVVADFGDAALDIDQDATFTVSGTSATDLTGDLTLTSTLLSNTNNTIYKDDDNVFDLETWFTNQDNNSVADDTLTAPSGAASTKRIINGATEAGVTATDVSAINSWFDATSYIGAIENAAGDWVTSWTVWLNQ